MRKDILTLLDLKNAKVRAVWVERFYSGYFCEDRRTPEEREAFDAWYTRKLRQAEGFLQGGSCGH